MKLFEREAPAFGVTVLKYRLATLADELYIVACFSAMLRELESLGHDVLPTERNLDIFWQHFFRRAILEEKHGIMLAFEEGACIGATFFTPEYTELDTPPGRAVAHGAWVHPKWRKRGIAWRLQAMAHGRLSTLGFTKLISNVVSTNDAGMSSAASAGAVITGVQTTVNLAAQIGE